MTDALRVADEVLKQGIRGIADLIVTPALINLDFADVRTTLKDKGLAHMGVGVAKGENRIIDAVRLAVNSPLLETTIEGAKGVILNIVGGPDLTLDEVTKAAGLIHGVVDYSANIIFGACVDENVQDEVEVTVIATGFPSGEEAAQNAARQNASYGAPLTVPPAEAPAPAQAPAAAPAVRQPAYQSAPNPYMAQPAPAAQPAQPVQPAAPQQPYYYGQPQQQGYPQPPVQSAQPAAQPQYQPEPEPAQPDQDERDKLPLFIRRMLGKK